MQKKGVPLRSALAVVFLVLWPFAYFWPITLARGVWFSADIALAYYPFGLELARALSQGRLPLWTTGLQAGFPLLAEGQVAALYPVTLLLFKFLPSEIAVSWEMLLHLAWAACGMYFCVKSFGCGDASAVLAGFAFSFNGFFLAQLMHMPIVITASWLPWLILLQNRFQVGQSRKDSRAGLWFLLTTLALGLMLLAGSAQIALLNSVAFVMFGLVGALFWNRPGDSHPGRPWTILRAALSTAVPLALGGGVAAIQLLPTAELVGYSLRGGDLGIQFLAGHSLPFEFLGQFVAPFATGEPAHPNSEYWGYGGIAVLLLAILALALRRKPLTIFCFAFALVALSLALGDSNPAYPLVGELPVLRLFRVPARYLLLSVFALTFLSAIALEELSRRVSSASGRQTAGIAVAFGLLTVGAIVLAHTQSLDAWLGAWQILPWFLGVSTAILIGLAWTHRIGRAALSTALVGLTIFDLASYGAPFLLTIDSISPLSDVNQVPRSTRTLSAARVPERYFTDDSIVPSFPAMRNALLRNIGLAYGKESAQVYSPLEFGAHRAYTQSLTPAMLNLLNARYFMIPLEPRFADHPPRPSAALALDVLDRRANIPPTAATAIEVTSFTEDAANLPEGTAVADLEVTLDSGETVAFPMRVGFETADWDYGRKNAESPAGSAGVARIVPSYWRSFGRPFDGYVYSAHYDLTPGGESRNVVGVSVRPRMPEANLSIEQVFLVREGAKSVSLAALTGKNDFVLRFMSDTAAVWENLSVMPRAFLVHHAQVMSSDRVLDQLRQRNFVPQRTVLLTEGQGLEVRTDPGQDAVEITRYESERVELTVTTEQPGYVVLADSWYPGWNATVDGEPTLIYRADFLFRSVWVEPGQHALVFEYHPQSLIWGAVVTLASLLLSGLVAFAVHRQYTFPTGNIWTKRAV